MKNQQIIEEIAKTIFGSEEVERMIQAGEDIPLHTLQGWRSLGPYMVKKGEHGIETRLWKRRKEDGNCEGTEEETTFYLAKSYLFTADQMVLAEQ